jgi:cell wall-associated NlpC family hydrolase
MESVSRFFRKKLLLKITIFLIPFFLIIIPILATINVIIGQSDTNNSSISVGNANVSATVLAWEPEVEKYADQFSMSQYVNLILAVIMQESGGNQVDVMQSSECGFNTDYPRVPDGITDPDYSIFCGVQELKQVFTEAGVKDANDIQDISLALQAYNFGDGFIAYDKAHGGYSEANAEAFSSMEAAQYGYSSYGDPEYAQHVLRYYITTNTATASSNLGTVVSIAQQQEGKPYVWGASGPDSFDCSGLVYYCYKNAGYNIQRETAQDYYNMSTQTSTPSIGDLVFFGTSGNIDHIGIYIGNDEMIDAPNSTEPVKVQNVNWSDFVGYGHLNL